MLSKPVEYLPSAEVQLERKEAERSQNLGWSSWSYLLHPSQVKVEKCEIVFDSCWSQGFHPCHTSYGICAPKESNEVYASGSHICFSFQSSFDKQTSIIIFLFMRVVDFGCCLCVCQIYVYKFLYSYKGFNMGVN